MSANLDKPKSVRLEASTICQLKCKSCYMRNHENSVGIGYLKYEDFVKFVNQNNYIKQIELSNSGEIFLNPDLLKIMKFAYENDIALTAYNGVNLNTVSDEVLEGLVKYKFQKLTCSIDGASQETYSQYRIGGDFNKVISNIKKINEYKKKYNSMYPQIKYQFIIFGHNEKEIPQAKKLAKELGADINFKFSWDKSFSPIQDVEFVKKELGTKYLSYEERLDEEKKHPLRHFCTKMWTQPQINWDGRLLGCCLIFREDYGVNVFESSLEKALKSDKFYYSKQMLMNKAPQKNGLHCSTCLYYKTMQETNSFITEDEILEYL